MTVVNPKRTFDLPPLCATTGLSGGCLASTLLISTLHAASLDYRVEHMTHRGNHNVRRWKQTWIFVGCAAWIGSPWRGGSNDSRGAMPAKARRGVRAATEQEMGEVAAVYPGLAKSAVDLALGLPRPEVPILIVYLCRGLAPAEEPIE